MVGSGGEKVVCLHREQWMVPIDGRPYKEFGTILRDRTLKFNYALHINFFDWINCKERVKTLKEREGICAAVIEMVRDELRGGAVSKVELKPAIKRWKRNSLKRLQEMLI